MFDPTIAEIRFGTGLSPHIAPPSDIAAMLAGLRGVDAIAKQFPIEPYDLYRDRITAYLEARRQFRRNRGTDEAEQFDQARKVIARASRNAYGTFFRNALLRRIHSETGLRERIGFFWQDHFTARGKVSIAKRATGPYVEEAIRPHITGRFEDLLIAVVTHPLMLTYLDQAQSVGPNSPAAKRAANRGRKRGLNENLAREILELHTLGVGAAYGQNDVRQLAELLTGLTLDRDLTFKFDKALAEPGAETILGQNYGAQSDLSAIKALLTDLARHPATARHISEKLARHFIADHPDAGLVDALEQTYLQTDGQLSALYETLLMHPASWQKEAANVKRPLDFIATSLRALDVGATTLNRTKDSDLRSILYVPLQIMGQPWQSPDGPDGWPEDNAHWITPQFMAARLQWALAAPQALRRGLPDPRAFARAALGNRLPQDVAFAAEAAENRWEGIALVLSSPAFQRQ